MHIDNFILMAGTVCDIIKGKTLYILINYIKEDFYDNDSIRFGQNESSGHAAV